MDSEFVDREENVPLCHCTPSRFYTRTVRRSLRKTHFVPLCHGRDKGSYTYISLLGLTDRPEENIGVKPCISTPWHNGTMAFSSTVSIYLVCKTRLACDGTMSQKTGGVPCFG